MQIEQLIGREFINTRSKHVDEWMSWYRGSVRDFHNYRLYNGDDYINVTMKSLQMGKYICESWANMLLNERCDIVIDNAQKQKDKLDKKLKEINFWVKGNESIEKAFALSYSTLYVNVTDLGLGSLGSINKSKAKATIELASIFNTYPLKIENREVIECAFVVKNKDNSQCASIHTLGKDGNYHIRNRKIDKDDKVIEDYDFNTNSPRPWFAFIRPNIASNFIEASNDNDEELGISILANSLDTLASIDSKYDAFYNEYLLSRKRIFVSQDIYSVDMVDGKPVKRFDPRDQQFYFISDRGLANGDPTDIKNQIKTSTDDIRFQAYIDGINAEIKYLTMKCGMGTNYFRFEGSGEMTATQVISENSTLFRSIKKHEILLETALIRIMDAFIYAVNTFTNDPIGIVKEINVKFDDSIIEDKGAEMERDKADVAAGLMSRLEYRMKWYGEDEKTAQTTLRKYMRYDIIDKYTSAVTQGLMTPEDFVKLVYEDKSPEEQAQIAEYITEFVKPASGIADIYGGLVEQGKEPPLKDFQVTVLEQSGEETTDVVQADTAENARLKAMDMYDGEVTEVKELEEYIDEQD